VEALRCHAGQSLRRLTSDSLTSRVQCMTFRDFHELFQAIVDTVSQNIRYHISQYRTATNL
jgi:hypothetical protein